MANKFVSYTASNGKEYTAEDIYDRGINAIETSIKSALAAKENNAIMRKLFAAYKEGKIKI